MNESMVRLEEKIAFLEDGHRRMEQTVREMNLLLLKLQRQMNEVYKDVGPEPAEAPVGPEQRY